MSKSKTKKKGDIVNIAKMINKLEYCLSKLKIVAKHLDRYRPGTVEEKEEEDAEGNVYVTKKKSEKDEKEEDVIETWPPVGENDEDYRLDQMTVKEQNTYIEEKFNGELECMLNWAEEHDVQGILARELQKILDRIPSKVKRKRPIDKEEDEEEMSEQDFVKSRLQRTLNHAIAHGLCVIADRNGKDLILAQPHRNNATIIVEENNPKPAKKPEKRKPISED